MEKANHEYVTMTIQFGVDQVQETYELLSLGSPDTSSSRLEQQFWSGREEGPSDRKPDGALSGEGTAQTGED